MMMTVAITMNIADTSYKYYPVSYDFPIVISISSLITLAMTITMIFIVATTMIIMSINAMRDNHDAYMRRQDRPCGGAENGALDSPLPWLDKGCDGSFSKSFLSNPRRSLNPNTPRIPQATLSRHMPKYACFGITVYVVRI